MHAICNLPDLRRVLRAVDFFLSAASPTKLTKRTHAHLFDAVLAGSGSSGTALVAKVS